MHAFHHEYPTGRHGPQEIDPLAGTVCQGDHAELPGVIKRKSSGGTRARPLRRCLCTLEVLEAILSGEICPAGLLVLNGRIWNNEIVLKRIKRRR